MLRALYEHGITPDLLIGTSVGAMNAAFIASRPQTSTTANDLARVWCGVRREHAFPTSLRTLVGGLSGVRDHLVPAYGLRRLAARCLDLEGLEDAAIPLHVVAYDLLAGREVVLSEGSALEAVVAAASIPGVFPPVRLGDRVLIDGGVANNTPISHAVELGAERIYVLTTQDPSRARTHLPHSAIDGAIRGLGLLVHSRLDADIALYREKVELIVLPAENALGVQPTDFDHSASLIREGYSAARRLLARIEAERRSDEGHLSDRDGLASTG
jgi:NTE family protein